MRCEETLRAASKLADEALVAEISRLVGCERVATAALIAHLAEFDARRLHLAAGFESLFRYCTEALRLSEHEAYNRIEAARLARRFPCVLDMLEEGALNLTAVRLLAPHLTEENQESLLREASHKTKKDVEAVVARCAPQPDVPSSIRKLPAPRSGTALTTDAGVDAHRPAFATQSADTTARVGGASTDVETARAETAGVGAEGIATAGQPATRIDSGALPLATAHPPAANRETVRALAPGRYAVRFTATAATCDKLHLAKDLLRHAVPDGDIATIVDRALTLLLEDLARKKFSATPRLRSGNQTRSPKAAQAAVGESEATLSSDAPSSGASSSGASSSGASSSGASSNDRHIPARVKRAVWRRDGGRCAFVSARAGARRCNTRAFLEFHHLRPYAVGGAATTDNIEIRCRAHNAYEADLFYGRREMDCHGHPGPAAELVPERVGPA